MASIWKTEKIISMLASIESLVMSEHNSSEVKQKKLMQHFGKLKLVGLPPP